MSHLTTTAVKGDTCPRCRAVILTGIAEGLHARVDLTPLNPAGEVAALLTGLWTYTLTPFGLVHRDATRIAGGSVRGPTLRAHRCASPPAAEHQAPTEAVTTSACDPDEPPY